MSAPKQGPAPPAAPAAPSSAEAPAGEDDRPHDPGADVVAQIEEALTHVQRSILLLQPVRPAWQAHYDKLRAVRDRLEEAFTAEQVERLRAGNLDLGGDVQKLKEVIDGLAAATQRAARTQEVLSYVTMAVDIASQIVIRLLPFL